MRLRRWAKRGDEVKITKRGKAEDAHSGVHKRRGGGRGLMGGLKARRLKKTQQGTDL